MTTRILIVVPSLHRFDAIGTDVLLQRSCLLAAGKEVHVYADQVDDALSSLVVSQSHCKELASDRNNLVIYHFGVYWRGLSDLLADAQARIWIKYHNITPPHFYAGWDEGSFHATAAGLNQALWLTKQEQVDLFVGDSDFNITELLKLADKDTLKSRILAPMVQLLVDETSPGTNNLQLAERTIHILFVGRVVPNKAHKHLLGVLHSFKAFFPNVGVKLHIAGGIAPSFQSYYSFLTTLGQETGIAENIVFWDKTPADTLKNLYRQATVFLCMSEHEGFCVPVIEAQQAGLPVIALARGAIPDTLGEDQFLLKGEVDYDLAACLIMEVAGNADLRQTLVENGRRNATRFSKSNLSHQFLQLIQNEI